MSSKLPLRDSTRHFVKSSSSAAFSSSSSSLSSLNVKRLPSSGFGWLLFCLCQRSTCYRLSANSSDVYPRRDLIPDFKRYNNALALKCPTPHTPTLTPVQQLWRSQLLCTASSSYTRHHLAAVVRETAPSAIRYYTREEESTSTNKK